VVASGPNSLIRDQVDTPPAGKGTTPDPGLMPTSPQLEAGMRMEPPPSAARATGTMAEATAAALPPEEPPGVWSRLQGLREAPKASLSVNGHRPSSGTLVLPTSSAPASRKRRTSSSSAAAGSGPVAAEPLRVGHPARSMLSLTATGTPARGSRPRSSRPSRARASALTSSVLSSRNAPSRPSRAAIRSRCSSSTSVGAARPALTAAAMPTAVSPT
jgi:hypothetical protein